MQVGFSLVVLVCVWGDVFVCVYVLGEGLHLKKCKESDNLWPQIKRADAFDMMLIWWT